MRKVSMRHTTRQHLALRSMALGLVALCPIRTGPQQSAMAQTHPSPGSAVNPMVTAARRLETMAPALVQSAQIKPGQLVAIHGGPQMVPAMEAMEDPSV